MNIDYLKTRTSIAAMSAAVGALGGAALTATVAMKRLRDRLELEYDLRLEDETDKIKKYYGAFNKTGSYATPQEAAEALLAEDAIAALREYSAKDVELTEATFEVPQTGDDTPEVVNIFAENIVVNENPYDFNEEVVRRESNKPHVISLEEFQTQDDYEEAQLTYYEKDGVLIDADYHVIPDTDYLVGDLNLRKFGHGSKDHNVVYVRNDEEEKCFEIFRNKGSYSKEVHGLDDEEDTLVHSDKPRKFRADRE